MIPPEILLQAYSQGYFPMADERGEIAWYSDAGPGVSGRTVTLEYVDLRDNTRHEVTYDADKPEEGLAEKSRPMPKDNP